MISEFIRTELRALPRHWPLWTLAPLLAFAGWKTLPVNADLYRTHLNFDPQGTDQTLDNYRIDAFAVYTSGLGWAQLFALVVGAYLVLRDPRLSRTPQVEPAPLLLLAKVAAAAVAGLVLVAVDLVTVLPVAHSHLADHEALPILRQEGVTPDLLNLADGSVWLVLVCAAAAVARRLAQRTR